MDISERPLANPNRNPRHTQLDLDNLIPNVYYRKERLQYHNGDGRTTYYRVFLNNTVIGHIEDSGANRSSCRIVGDGSLSRPAFSYSRDAAKYLIFRHVTREYFKNSMKDLEPGVVIQTF